MRVVFYSASTSAQANSTTRTTYQPFRADTWEEMSRLYPDCEFVVVGPLNGSYIFDVAEGEICRRPEHVKYVLLESGISAEKTAELIAEQKPDVDYIMQLETAVTGMEKINYCEVVISTDQGKEDILNVLNELGEEFPGLVSDEVKANAGTLIQKYE